MAITQLSIFLENKPGQLHEVVKRLSEAGINIRAMTIAEVRDFGILRIIVSDVEKAKAVLEDDHIITTTEVVSAIMEDKAGALYDILQEIYKTYGYYVEKVVSVTLPGKDGLAKMKEIMANLRANPPKELAGLKVTAVRDYLKGTRTADGKEEPTGLPTSDVLYFELEKGDWVCIRPSGTEPKIKLYINAVSDDPEKTRKLLEAYANDAIKLLESF